MRFKEVGEWTLTDPRFASALKETVLQARRDGVGSEAWIRLARYFAENEDELALLIPPTKKGKPGKVDTLTLTTLIVLSDTFTGTTTTQTTTTTSRLCSLPGVCEGAGARRPVKKKAAKVKKTK